MCEKEFELHSSGFSAWLELVGGVDGAAALIRVSKLDNKVAGAK